MNLLIIQNARSGKLVVNVVNFSSMEHARVSCREGDDVPLGIISPNNEHYAQKGLEALNILCEISDDGSGGDGIRAALEHLLTLTAEFGFEQGKTTSKNLDDLR